MSLSKELESPKDSEKDSENQTESCHVVTYTPLPSPLTTRSALLSSSAPASSALFSPSTPTRSPLFSPSTPTRSPLFSLSTPARSALFSPSTPARSALFSPSTPTRSPLLSPSTPASSPLFSPSTPTRSPLFSPSTPTRSLLFSPSTPTRSPLFSPSTPTRSPLFSLSTPTRSPLFSLSTPARSALFSPSTPAKSATSSQTATSFNLTHDIAKLTALLRENFNENDTLMKVALYDLSKNEVQEAMNNLEKLRNLQQNYKEQLQQRVQLLRVNASNVSQQVVSLQQREMCLLHAQAEMQVKMDTYNSIFDDEMEVIPTQKVEEVATQEEEVEKVFNEGLLNKQVAVSDEKQTNEVEKVANKEVINEQMAASDENPKIDCHSAKAETSDAAQAKVQVNICDIFNVFDHKMEEHAHTKEIDQEMEQAARNDMCQPACKRQLPHVDEEMEQAAKKDVCQPACKRKLLGDFENE